MTMNERICTHMVYSDSWWMFVLILVIFISEHAAQLNIRSKYTSLTRICHALLTRNTRRLLSFIIWFLLYATTDDKSVSISAVRIQYNGFWDWSCQTHAIGEDSGQIRRKHVLDVHLDKIYETLSRMKDFEGSFYPSDSSLILLLRVIIRTTGYGFNIQDQCKYRFKFVLFGYHSSVCNIIFISPHDHTSEYLVNVKSRRNLTTSEFNMTVFHSIKDTISFIF